MLFQKTDHLLINYKKRFSTLFEKEPKFIRRVTERKCEY